MKTKVQVENCLSSDLSNMILEFNNKSLDDESIYGYFSKILLDANVDSEIIVDVLERKSFGELGKDEAMHIKIVEGW